jgi:hypothetical protein
VPSAPSAPESEYATPSGTCSSAGSAATLGSGDAAPGSFSTIARARVGSTFSALAFIRFSSPLSSLFT